MKFNTDDTRITGMAEVRDAQSLLEEIPLSEQGSSFVFNTRKACSEIIKGNDPRLLVVVGPCSIHDPVAAIEYAEKLAEASRQWDDELLILMRVYFEKPRTTVGWKGLINDPHLNDSFDINTGLATARQLLRDITELGLGSGTEYLDPITPQYIGDLVCWSAIGARTTEKARSTDSWLQVCRVPLDLKTARWAMCRWLSMLCCLPVTAIFFRLSRRQGTRLFSPPRGMTTAM